MGPSLQRKVGKEGSASVSFIGYLFDREKKVNLTKRSQQFLHKFKIFLQLSDRQCKFRY